MGLFSKSSSSSSSTSVETTSVGAQDESTAISIGDGATANFTDGGAVAGALDFARLTLEKSFQASGNVAAIGAQAQQAASERLDEAQSGGAQRLLYLAVAAFGLLYFMGKR